jgi:hypothetical protein
MERMEDHSVNCGQMSAPILTFSFTVNLLSPLRQAAALG